ncbi:DUF169 domain-containing protein [Acididesulfobacillus acetoxydans]|nr:DUF169 domain-containing protein [Acididesulfobacillus acetoxydans]
MTQRSEQAAALKSILQLNREPVGVKFLTTEDYGKLHDSYDDTTKTRYCQALMRAGQGAKIVITDGNISCPASAAAFGLKPLPEVLRSGQMLLNMGLFASLDAGKKAMEGMTRLEQGAYQAVLLSPLKDIEVEPDVVVLESKPEHLMWTSLASIYTTGERLHYSTAVFQATCVDATVIPFVKGIVNSTLGCYGCRDATNINDTEGLTGFPYRFLEDILNNLVSLSQKAMPVARSKKAYQVFHPEQVQESPQTH